MTSIKLVENNTRYEYTQLCKLRLYVVRDMCQVPGTSVVRIVGLLAPLVKPSMTGGGGGSSSHRDVVLFMCAYRRITSTAAATNRSSSRAQAKAAAATATEKAAALLFLRFSRETHHGSLSPPCLASLRGLLWMQW